MGFLYKLRFYINNVITLQVGDVAYVELFNDENGKPRGCGVVEFTNSEAMKKALFVMHRYELNGRKLVLKEETGNLLCCKASFVFYYNEPVINNIDKDIRTLA